MLSGIKAEKNQQEGIVKKFMSKSITQWSEPWGKSLIMTILLITPKTV